MGEPAPKRQRRKAPAVFECPNAKQKWSLDEKRGLLEGIQRHGTGDVSLLQPFVPSRNSKEIEWLIQRIKNSKTVEKKKKNNSPLDKWVNLVSDLVEDEQTDFSLLLPRVMAVISHYTCSEATPGPDLRSRKPNYSRIYQYIESVLLNRSATELSPIEAAIMLELMYGLASKLDSSDLEDVQKLLLWKFDLLNIPVFPGTRTTAIEMTRVALENEWPGGGDNREETPGGGTETGELPVSPGPSGAAAQTSSPDNPQPPAASPSNPQVSPATSRDTQRASGKCQLRFTQTTDDPPSKKPNRAPSEAGCETEGGEQELHPLTLAERATEQPQAERIERQAPQKVDRRKRKEPRSVFKKPPLYTLNPLCIPVGFLKMKPKPGS